MSPGADGEIIGFTKDAGNKIGSPYYDNLIFTLRVVNLLLTVLHVRLAFDRIRLCVFTTGQQKERKSKYLKCRASQICRRISPYLSHLAERRL